MTEPVFWLSDGVFWLGSGPEDGSWMENSGVRLAWIQQVHWLADDLVHISLPRADGYRWNGAALDSAFLLHLLGLILAKQEVDLILLVEPGCSMLLGNAAAVGRYNLLPRAALPVRLSARQRQVDGSSLAALARDLESVGLDAGDISVISSPPNDGLLAQFPAAAWLEAGSGLLDRISRVAAAMEERQGSHGMVIQPSTSGSQVTLIERID